eukprot:954130_1
MPKLLQLSSLKEKGNTLSDWESHIHDDKEQVISLPELESLLPSNAIIADCTATKNTTPHLISYQQNNIAVTMTNKKPLTGPYTDFDSLTSDRNLIGFECTVGAGLPIISTFTRLLDSGDTIIKINGVLSTTIDYILSELQNGTVSFSECVKNARKQGLTEPDPRDDLSGIDVARKALILARCMGIEIELSDINIDSLYPVEWESLSVDEFMNKLHDLDDDMGRRILKAKKQARRIRYAAVITRDGVKVSLIDVPIHNPLYNLVGTDNMVSIETQYYSSPIVISGPGGGIDVTAAFILSDVYQLRGSQ